jgi:hypothetical protein
MSTAPTVIDARGKKKFIPEIIQTRGIQIIAGGAHTNHCALQAFSMQNET